MNVLELQFRDKDPLKAFNSRCVCGHREKDHSSLGCQRTFKNCSCTEYRPASRWLMEREAERRFIAWQKAARKKGTWYEILKVPHKGSKHAILVVRKFRDFQKAEAYALKRNEKAEGAASFDVQVRNGVVPERPKDLLGFDPQEALRQFSSQPSEGESTMAKVKVKGKKSAGNGATKVKKDKAYYLRCAGGKEACGSGDFIRGHILQGKLDAAKIAEMAKKKFKGTTKPSDVYWNRGQLKAAGIAVPKMGGKE